MKKFNLFVLTMMIVFTIALPACAETAQPGVNAFFDWSYLQRIPARWPPSCSSSSFSNCPLTGWVTFRRVREAKNNIRGERRPA